MVASAIITNTCQAGPMEDAQAAGTSSGATIQGLFGNKIGFNDNISTPLTSNATLLKTIDGSTSFSADLATPSSNKFLDLVIQPSPTGDLQLAMFSIDTNMDGTTDYVYQVPRPISGVCGNGYVTCTTGTWSGCSYYKWISDSNGQLSDVSAQSSDLGGCYCINSSCGSNLVWSNANIILKDLGGGGVSAIQKANIGFMVTNVSVTPVSISYYGRLTNNATMSTTNATTILPTPATAQDYYNNPTALSSEVNNLVAVSASDPDSLYSMIYNSSAATATQRTVTQCSIKRNGSVSTVSEDIGYDVAFIIDYDADGSSKECNWATQSFACKTIYGGGMGYTNCKKTVMSHLTDIVHSLYPVSAGQSCISMDVKGTVDPLSPHPGCNGSGNDSTHAFVRVWCYTKLPHSGSQITSNIPIVREKRDEYSETVSDGCSVYAADTNCRLQNEEIDGVVTVNNYNVTGLSGLSGCRTFNGQVGNFDICRPWWEKKRTYFCENPVAYDFSDIGTRYGSLEQSFVQSGNSVTFTDNTKDASGNWTNQTVNLTLISTPTGSACEQSCKTKAPKEDNEVTTSGLGSTLRRNNANAYDYLYRICVNSVCPIELPGEVIISNCACGSSIDEAATAVQAMRLAGKDTICTSGVEKPLQ
ncbi:conserved hypothetical protein (plasmid) [Pelobacter propionicus DSM 2379]|uniref:Uncharacterized protein n=1 Tax=Pelobacter propionicus (strain DSM 2379 / NBRC 103807 / OttBd1) TaxID=338966 RepID=A0R7Q7_PELPD|nr:conserved hypothetical protein [Pelobacter propionicus DSM 2379]